MDVLTSNNQLPVETKLLDVLTSNNKMPGRMWDVGCPEDKYEYFVARVARLWNVMTLNNQLLWRPGCGMS